MANQPFDPTKLSLSTGAVPKELEKREFDPTFLTLEPYAQAGIIEGFQTVPLEPLGDLDVGLVTVDVPEEQKYLRGENQSNWIRALKSVPRYAFGTALKMAQTVGFVGGIPAAIGEWDYDKIVNNTMVNLFEGLEEDMKESALLKIYHTRGYDKEDKSFAEVLDKVFSIEYLADDGADMLAFTTQAIGIPYTMGALGTGIKGAKWVNKMIMGVKAGKNILGATAKGVNITEAAAINIPKLAKNLNYVQTLVLSAANEATFESKDFETGILDRIEREGIAITPEIRDRIEKGRKNVFWANLILLLISNNVEALMLYGGFKSMAKGILAGTLTQGLMEETPQWSFQTYHEDYALGKTSQGILEGYMDYYGKALTDPEGQEATVAGSIMGFGFGVVGGVRGRKGVREEKERKQRLLDLPIDLYSIKPSHLYKTDKEGKVMMDEAGNFIKDKDKEADFLKRMAADRWLAQQFNAAVVSNNTVRKDFFRDMKLSQQALDFIREEGGVESLIDKITVVQKEKKDDVDYVPDTDIRGNTISIEQEEAELKRRVQEFYNIYRNVYSHVQNMKVENTETGQDFRNEMLYRLYLEGVHQSFLQSKLKEIKSVRESLDRELANENSIIESINADVRWYEESVKHLKKLKELEIIRLHPEDLEFKKDLDLAEQAVKEDKKDVQKIKKENKEALSDIGIIVNPDETIPTHIGKKVSSALDTQRTNLLELETEIKNALNKSYDTFADLIDKTKQPERYEKFKEDEEGRKKREEKLANQKELDAVKAAMDKVTRENIGELDNIRKKASDAIRKDVDDLYVKRHGELTKEKPAEPAGVTPTLAREDEIKASIDDLNDKVSLAATLEYSEEEVKGFKDRIDKLQKELDALQKTETKEEKDIKETPYDAEQMPDMTDEGMDKQDMDALYSADETTEKGDKPKGVILRQVDTILKLARNDIRYEREEGEVLEDERDEEGRLVREVRDPYITSSKVFNTGDTIEFFIEGYAKRGESTTVVTLERLKEMLSSGEITVDDIAYGVRRTSKVAGETEAPIAGNVHRFWWSKKEREANEDKVDPNIEKFIPLKKGSLALRRQAELDLELLRDNLYKLLVEKDKGVITTTITKTSKGHPLLLKEYGKINTRLVKDGKLDPRMRFAVGNKGVIDPLSDLVEGTVMGNIKPSQVMSGSLYALVPTPQTVNGRQVMFPSIVKQPYLFDADVDMLTDFLLSKNRKQMFKSMKDKFSPGIQQIIKDFDGNLLRMYVYHGPKSRDFYVDFPGGRILTLKTEVTEKIATWNEKDGVIRLVENNRDAIKAQLKKQRYNVVKGNIQGEMFPSLKIVNGEVVEDKEKRMTYRDWLADKGETRFYAEVMPDGEVYYFAQKNIIFKPVEYGTAERLEKDTGKKGITVLPDAEYEGYEDVEDVKGAKTSKTDKKQDAKQKAVSWLEATLESDKITQDDLDAIEAEQSEKMMVVEAEGKINIKAKKADIERRREEELDKHFEVKNYLGKVQRTYKDIKRHEDLIKEGSTLILSRQLPSSFEGAKKIINDYKEINAKYDAELAALKPTIEEAPEAVSIPIPVKKKFPVKSRVQLQIKTGEVGTVTGYKGERIIVEVGKVKHHLLPGEIEPYRISKELRVVTSDMPIADNKRMKAAYDIVTSENPYESLIEYLVQTEDEELRDVVLKAHEVLKNRGITVGFINEAPILGLKGVVAKTTLQPDTKLPSEFSDIIKDAYIKQVKNKWYYLPLIEGKDFIPKAATDDLFEREGNEITENEAKAIYNFLPYNINLNLPVLKSTNNTLQHILGHELSHLISINAFHNPKTNAEKIFRDNITDLFKYAKENLTNKNQYGLRTAEEFLSEAHNNPEFKQDLKDLKVRDTNRTVFQKIIDFIAELLGIKKVETVYTLVDKYTNSFLTSGFVNLSGNPLSRDLIEEMKVPNLTFNESMDAINKVSHDIIQARKDHPKSTVEERVTTAYDNLKDVRAGHLIAMQQENTKEEPNKKYVRRLQYYIDNLNTIIADSEDNDTFRKIKQHSLYYTAGVEAVIMGEEMEYDEEDSDNSKESNWIEDFQRDLKLRISQELRNFLAFIPVHEYKFNRSLSKKDPLYKKAFPKVSSIGTETYIPFDTVYNDLIIKLQDITPDMFIEQMDRLGTHDATIQHIADMLREYRDSDNLDNESLFIQFAGAMSRNFGRFITPRFDFPRDENRKQTTETDVIYTNRTEAHNVVTKMWKGEFKKQQYVRGGIIKKDSVGNIVINTSKAKKLLTLFNEIEEEHYDDLPYRVHTARNILEDIGISIDVDAIDSMLDDPLKVEKGFISERVIDATRHILNTLAGNEDYSKGNPYDNEMTSLNDLAKVSLLTRTNVYSATFRDEAGRMISSVVNHTSLSHTYQDLMITDLAKEMMERSSFYEDNLWMEEIANKRFNRKNFEFATFATLARKMRIGGGREWNDLSPLDKEFIKINAFFDSGHKTGWFHTTTFGERKSKKFTKIPKYEVHYDKDGNINDTALGLAYRLFKSEMKRIRRVQDAIDNYRDVTLFGDHRDMLIEDYHYVLDKNDKRVYEDAPGLRFHLFPSLNNLVVKVGEVERKLTDRDVPWENYERDIKDEIQDMLIREVDINREIWQGLGMTNTKQLFFDSRTTKKYEDLLLDYTFNYFLTYGNFSHVFIGDIAQSKDYNNAAVRAHVLTAPGGDLIGMTGSMKTLVYEDVVTRSPLIESWEGSLREEYERRGYPEDKIQKRTGEVLQGYDKIISTDSYAVVPLSGYRKMVRGWGKLDNDMDKLLTRMEKGEDLSTENLVVVAQALKPVYDRLVWDNDLKMDRRILFKFAVIPLYPKLTEHFGIAEDFRRQLEGSGADIVFFKTANKLGKKKIQKVFGDDGKLLPIDQDNIQHLSWEGMRLQQEIPYDKETKHINADSQGRKLIYEAVLNPEIADIEYDIRGEKYTPQGLLDHYENLYKANVAEGYERFLKRLGVKEKTDDEGKATYSIQYLDKVNKLLMREAIKRKYGLHTILSLQLEKVDPTLGEVEGNLRFAVPLYLLPQHIRFESLLNSVLTKEIIRQERPGEGLLQSSGMLFKEYKTSRQLQYIRKDPKTGKLLPAQVWVSTSYFGNRFTEDTLPDWLRRGFGFRQPDQGPNSTVPVEIHLLPRESGTLVVLPDEWIQQSGTDNDGDEVYLYTAPYRVDKNGDVKVVEYRTDIEKIYEDRYDGILGAFKWIDAEVSEIREEQERKLIFETRAVDQLLRDIFGDFKDFGVIEEDVEAAMRDKMAMKEYSYDDYLKLKEKVKSIPTLEEFKEQNKDIPVERVNSKSARDKALLDIHLAIGEHPAMLERFLSPNTLGTFKEDNDEVEDRKRKVRREHGLPEEEVINTPASVSVQARIEESNISGKRAISLYSLFATYNSLSRKTKMKEKLVVDDRLISTGAMFNDDSGNLYQDEKGKKVGDKNIGAYLLNKATTLDSGQLISNIGQFKQSGALDNPKKQVLEGGGINTETIAADQFISKHFGRMSSAFLMQPIVQRWVKVYRNKRSLSRPRRVMGDLEMITFDEVKDGVISEIKRVFGEEVTFKQDALNIKPISKKELLRDIEIAEEIRIDKHAFIGKSKEDYRKFLDDQLNILNAFIEYRKRGREMLSMTFGYDSDVRGLGPNYYSIQQRVRHIEKIREGDMDYIEGMEEIGNNSFLGDLIDKAVIPAMEIFGNKEFNLYGTKFYKDLMTRLENLGVLNFRDPWMARQSVANFNTIRREVNTSLWSNINNGLFGEEDTLANIRRQLFITEGEMKSLPIRIMEYRDTPEGADMVLLHRLEVDPAIVPGEPDMMTFNTIGMEESEVTHSMLTLEEMLKSPDIETRLLAEDLIRWAYLASGSNLTNTSLTNAIPPSYLSQVGIGNYYSVKSTIDGNTEYWRVLNDNYTVDRFLNQLVRNIPALLDRPSVSTPRGGRDVIIMKVEDDVVPPEYIAHRETYGTGDERRRMLVPYQLDITEGDNAQYVKLNPLGFNRMREYDFLHPIEESIYKRNNVKTGVVPVITGETKTREAVKPEVKKVKFKPEVPVKPSKLKEGIDFVFEQNPELANIGNQEQYLQYLDTIFPDSKVKDIVYHASYLRNKDFSLIQERSFAKETNGGIHFGTKNQAIIRAEEIGRRDIFEKLWDGSDLPEYFSKKIYNKSEKDLTQDEYYDIMGYVFEEKEFLQKLEKGGYKIFPAIININNFIRIKDEGKNNNLFKNNDSIIYTNLFERDYSVPEDTSTKLLDSYAVKDYSQIHILGSNQDIEKFKKFVEVKPEVPGDLETALDLRPTEEDPIKKSNKWFPDRIKEKRTIAKDNLVGYCNDTARESIDYLKSKGLEPIPHYRSMFVINPFGDVFGHKVAVVKINGKGYVYDMPQSEQIEAVTKETFRWTDIYRPRLIEISKESLRKNYKFKTEKDLDESIKSLIEERIYADFGKVSLETIKDNIVEAKPEEQYQITAERIAPDVKLDNIIKKFLNQIGVSVEAVETLKTNKGLDAIAVADMVRKVVRVTSGKADITTLPEEAAHFMVELLGVDHPMVIRMMNLIDKTDIYTAVKEEYDGEYADETSLKKEAVGKFITKYVIQQHREVEKNRTLIGKLLATAQKIWERIKQLFRNADETALQRDIDEAFGLAASKLIKGDVSDLNWENVDNEQYFQMTTEAERIRQEQLESDPYLTYKDRLHRRIGFLQRKKVAGDKKKNARLQREIIALQKNIDELEEKRKLSLMIKLSINELEDIEKKIREYPSMSLNEKSDFHFIAREQLATWVDIDKIIDTGDKALQKKLEELSGKAERLLNKDVRNLIADYAAQVYNTNIPEEQITPSDLKAPLDKTGFLTMMGLDPSVSNNAQIRSLQNFVHTFKYYEDEAKIKLVGDIDEAMDKVKKYARSKGMTINDVHKIMEQRDKDDKWTKNIVTPYRIEFYHQWDKVQQDAYAEGMWKELRDWEDANGKRVVDWDFYEEERKEQAAIYGESDKVYLTWVDEYNPKGRGEHSNFYTELEPGDQWKDPRWSTIKEGKWKGTPIEEYYDFLYDKQDELKALLPPRYSKGENPFFTVKREIIDSLNKRAAALIKNGLTNTVKEWVKDSFMVSVTPTEDTVLRHIDTNLPVKTIPIYFMDKELDASQVSNNFGEVLKVAGGMAYHYHYMSEIQEPVEMMRRLISEAAEKELNDSGKQKTDRWGKLQKVVKNNKNAVAQMDYYIDYMLYGLSRKDAKPMLPGGKPGEKKFSHVRAIDWLIGITQLKGMGLNFNAPMTNVFFGSISNLIHAAGREDFELKHAYKALGMAVRSSYDPKLRQKIDLLMKSYNVHTLVLETAYGNNLQDKLLGKSYVMMAKTEWFNQSQVMTATMMATKIKDKNGKEGNVYDAYKVVDGKLVWDEKNFGEDPYKPFSHGKRLLRNKIRQTVADLHGAYAQDLTMKIKEEVLGRAMMVFRTWLPRSYAVYFLEERPDIQTGRMRKGRFVTLRDLGWNKSVKALMTSLISLSRGSKYAVSEVDKANIMKLGYTMRMMIAVNAAALILGMVKVDDDDEITMGLHKYLLRQSYRVDNELSFWVSFDSAQEIVRNIAPPMRTLTDFINVGNAISRAIQGNDTLLAGPHKGRSNVLRRSINAVPLFGNIQTVFELPGQIVTKRQFR